MITPAPNANSGASGERQATAAPFAIVRKTFLRLHLAIAALVLHGTQVTSEVITFAADSDVVIVRGRQAMDFAIYEVLGSEDGEIRCVAMDKAGVPLAVTVGFVQHAAIMFQDLKVTDVDRVICKYQ